jgi:hypothetical protein
VTAAGVVRAQLGSPERFRVVLAGNYESPAVVASNVPFWPKADLNFDDFGYMKASALEKSGR